MGLYEEGFTQNRELSWLRYDERVLEEALDESVPLFERLNFVAIFVSNLEEFIQVRVGGLIYDEGEDNEIDEKSGMNATDQLIAIYDELKRLFAKKDQVHEFVDQKLARAGLVRVMPHELSEAERMALSRVFHDLIKGRLKTHIITDEDEFPYLDQDKPYIVARLNTETEDEYAVVDVPGELEKVMVLDNGSKGGPFRYILTEDVIKMSLSSLFSPFEPVEIYTIDIARTAEIVLDDPSNDQLRDMKKIAKMRKYSAPDKLIVDGKMSDGMADYLISKLGLRNEQVLVTTHIDYGYVGELEDKLPEAMKEKFFYKKFEPFNQLKLGHGPMIDRIKHGEILSCYPYDTMDPFLKLLEEAGTDERVKEIRMTIYRLSSQPKIVEYLINAANNGKKVSVVMELRARFDEENNIDWTEKLKANGCKVHFGEEKYKIHSKLCQIVLNCEDGKKRYISHLSTGNFNEKTAKKYTDMAILTYDQRIGEAVDELWHDMMDSDVGSYDRILTSPKTMKKTLIELIRREAKKGKDGRIFIKVNSVTDEELIEELMKASCAGCRIKMIVRGICCLLPGVELCTENITVVNLVGRFLEHSRVYVFGEGDDEKMYISSADLMTRNMEKRIELACPIYSEELRNRIRAILILTFRDNVKGRIMNSKGLYEKKKDSQNLIDSQTLLMKSFQI